MGLLSLTDAYPPSTARPFRAAPSLPSTKEGELKFEQFEGVIPNPTVETVSEGAKLAKAFQADVVLGIGGSSLDAAKAVAVEATHDGSCWDYLFFKQKPTDRTLPVIAVGTTAGTGSQVTQVAVVTDTATRAKSALYDNHRIPRVALVDPALTLSRFVEAARRSGGGTAGAGQAIDGACRLHPKSKGPERHGNPLDHPSILLGRPSGPK